MKQVYNYVIERSVLLLCTSEDTLPVLILTSFSF